MWISFPLHLPAIPEFSMLFIWAMWFIHIIHICSIP